MVDYRVSPDLLVIPVRVVHKGHKDHVAQEAPWDQVDHLVYLDQKDHKVTMMLKVCYICTNHFHAAEAKPKVVGSLP